MDLRRPMSRTSKRRPHVAIELVQRLGEGLSTFHQRSVVRYINGMHPGMFSECPIAR